MPDSPGTHATHATPRCSSSCCCSAPTPRPPRFAQLVGLIVVGTGLVFAAFGVTTAVPVAAALALVAAFLNAAFGLCLGCERCLLLRRWSPQHG